MISASSRLSIPERVAVIGASGFVGAAVAKQLRDDGFTVMACSAPRLRVDSAESCLSPPNCESVAFQSLTKEIAGAHAVVNCAGISDATSSDRSSLLGANGALPGLVAAATREAGVRRLVHVSSAAVQGSRWQLDATEELAPFSLYSWSKAIGERAVQYWGTNFATIYRPPGVHAASRAVTRRLVSLSRSPLSSIAAPGTQRTPQALLNNVASAIAFLATTSTPCPRIVSHPWEGLTTRDLLFMLSGREPVRLSAPAARTLVRSLSCAGDISNSAAALSRRLEMCWFGQEQAPSWLTSAGWSPPEPTDTWIKLALNIENQSKQEGRE